jgi:hypothetical protein
MTGQVAEFSDIDLDGLYAPPAKGQAMAGEGFAEG